MLFKISCSGDENLERMEEWLTKTGRGRRPKLMCGPLTHKLLLQLEMLRVKHGVGWDETEDLMTTCTKGEPLQGLSLRFEIEAVAR